MSKLLLYYSDDPEKNIITVIKNVNNNLCINLSFSKCDC